MKKNKFVTIGLIQTKVSPDIKSNVEKTVRLIGQAAKKGAQIVCLQELFQTPYFPQWEKMRKNDYAESMEGYTVSEMKKAAKKYRLTLIVPIYEYKQQIPTKTNKKQLPSSPPFSKVSPLSSPPFSKGGTKGGYFNTAIVIDKKGGIIGQYHKVHIPHDPGFYEKEYFEHSQEGFKTFTVDGVKFSVLICYDQWFPEAARASRLLGAEIIFYPTAIGDIIGYKPEGDWHDAWETSMRGHAIHNSVFVAAVNRVGVEGRVKFFGQSFVSDPFGKIMARAGKDKEEILVQKIDLTRNEFFSEGWGFMRNRRPDAYKDIVSNKLIKKSKKLQNVAHYKDEKKALQQ